MGMPPFRLGRKAICRQLKCCRAWSSTVLEKVMISTSHSGISGAGYRASGPKMAGLWGSKLDVIIKFLSVKRHLCKARTSGFCAERKRS